MPIELKYILPPLVGAVIGWLTNYTAIKLLFRPHNPISIFGIKIQGLIPKRRKDIAQSIARTIENELLSSDDLADVLNTVDWKSEVEKTVEDAIDHRLNERLKLKGLKKIPLIGLLSENIIYHIKYLISSEILAKIEEKKGEIATTFKESVDMEKMLAYKIDSLDLKSFEGLLTSFITKELRHIELLGAIMGFLIGLSQAILFYFLA